MSYLVRSSLVLGALLWTACGSHAVPSPATCSDGVRNGSETDVDCGGSCGDCALTRGCAVDGDCASGHCFDGSCVECATEVDCPPAPTECGTAVCASHACGFTYAAAGSLAPTQLGGDCHTRHCLAQGALSDDVDDSDLPIDGNPCTADVCSGGEPSNPPESLDTACGAPGAGLRCDGLGACVRCVDAADCPLPSGECEQATCVEGVCGSEPRPGGTVLTAQTAGDCRLRVCDSAGAVQSAVDDGDLPRDGNPCTQDLCTAGSPSNPPEPLATACGAAGAGLSCDGQGACVQCTAASQCPQASGDCDAATCVQGTCGFGLVSAGTLARSQTAGDCRSRVCNADGSVRADALDSDLPVDGNPCTADVCTGGVPSNPPEPLDTACGATGAGLRCDGLGACVQCVYASECPQAAGECDEATCESGVCGFALVPAGTQARTQTSHDCQVRLCTADGSVVSDALDSDLPVDGNACTADVCAGGVASNPPEPPGSSCGPAGQGLVCDGAGSCVACLAAEDCPAATGDCDVPVCASGVCGFASGPADALARSQTPGDCQVRLCNADGTVRSEADDGDISLDGNACTQDLCVNGVPSHPPQPEGTPCGTGVTCNATGSCGQCVTAADCPQATGECDVATCTNSLCGFDFVTAGTLARTQVSGDCKVQVCGTGGAVSSTPLDSDVPVDGIVCTSDVCTAGVPSNPPAPIGLACGTNLGCNGSGSCVSVMTVVQQPATAVVTAPDPGSFSVVTVGGSALSYQWQLNGADIAGATSSSFTTSDTDFFLFPLTSTFSYRVRITGPSTVTSSAASLVVVAPNPTYPPAGDPVPVNGRALTVLPSYTVDAVHFADGAFRLGYAELFKDPVWTAYADFEVSATLANSTASYAPDPRLAAPRVDGAVSFNYLGTGLGFDRGHMVPRADVSYRFGPTAGDNATMMSNLIPQVSYLNQRLWQTLEQAVGGDPGSTPFSNGLAALFRRVWIYSGPVFTAATQYWVPALSQYTSDPSAVPAANVAIAVPTAVYKVLVVEPLQGEPLPRVLAWMCSNRGYSTAENADVWKYVTSVARVEALTGLDFFPGLPHDASLTALKETVDVRGWGSDFEKPSGPNVHILQPGWDRITPTGTPGLTGDPVAVGSTVTFVGAAIPNYSGGTLNPATGCTWTFGDLTAQVTGTSATHAYAAAGTFTVSFACTDGDGVRNSISRSIQAVAAANSPPTISTLPDRTTAVGVPATVSFTVGDDATAPGLVSVVAATNNTTLIPAAGIQVTNTAGAVSLVLPPAAGKTGTAVVTVSATDGNAATSRASFLLAVTNASTNTPPTISGLSATSTPLDTPTTVRFGVTDDHTSPGSILVSAASSNTTLLPPSGMQLTNSAGSVSLVLTPATGQTGTSTVLVTATDGAGSSSTGSFLLTVTGPANAPPTISGLAPTSTLQDTPITVGFTVSDDHTAAGSIQVTAASSNTTLLPASGLQVTNDAGAVSLVMTPAAGQTGTSTISVNATDGEGLSSTGSFVLTVTSGATSHVLDEAFETGSKGSYASAVVTLSSGSWTLSDALLGTSTSDRRNGAQSVRLRNGFVRMEFDWSYGAKTVSVAHAKYGSDADSSWGLWYSTDGGGTWTQAGSTVTTTSTTLSTATFTLNATGSVRLDFRKTDGTTSRVNLDDVQVVGY